MQMPLNPGGCSRNRCLLWFEASDGTRVSDVDFEEGYCRRGVGGAQIKRLRSSRSTPDSTQWRVDFAADRPGELKGCACAGSGRPACSKTSFFPSMQRTHH